MRTIFVKNKSLLGKVAWQIGPAALFFLLVILVFPIWQSFQIDADEGVNLGKAMLVEQGFELYNEIWSDQPPHCRFREFIVVGILPNT